MEQTPSLVTLARGILQDKENQTSSQTFFKHREKKVKHSVKHRITQKGRNREKMGTRVSNIGQTFLYNAKNGTSKKALFYEKIEKISPQRTEEELKILYRLYEKEVKILEHKESSKELAEEKALKKIERVVEHELVQEVLNTFSGIEINNIEFTSNNRASNDNVKDNEQTKRLVLSRTDLRQLYEERAGIIEYDGGYSREEAEKMALEEIKETWCSTSINPIV